MTLPKHRVYVTRPRWYRPSEVHVIRYLRDSRRWALSCAASRWLVYDLPGEGRMVGQYDDQPPVNCPRCLDLIDKEK